MKIAVEGCAHGELEKIYECIETLQEREAIRVDLLICCGDFQAVRNENDLCAMAVPQKYQNMCTFYKYYSGERRAPILTIFIGGNHEASNYLQELPFGGWVAPNIYYLGRAGVVKFGDLRIGGLSGIFKGQDYLQGLWESPPYNQNSLRSVYHVRSLDYFRLSQLKDKVHIMLSHDWPRNITDYGNKEQLLRYKPFLRDDIEANQLGSAPAEKLLHTLKPDYWFAAHLHCQFVALVKHDDGEETKFLALDKCLPKRRHLQIVDTPPEYDGDKLLKHDAEWLAILKNTNHLLTVKNVDCHMPGPGSNERYIFTPTEEEKETVLQLMVEMTIKEESFVKTAPVYQPGRTKGVPLGAIVNPQTVTLCDKLGIDDPIQVVMARAGREMRQPYVESVNSPVPLLINTPIKSKMSLPAPATPSENDNDSREVSQLQDTILSPESVSFSESTCSTLADCLQVVMARAGRELRQPHDESVNSPLPPLINTPIKSKMSLPAPATPSENDNDNREVSQLQDSLLSPESASFLKSTCSTLADCSSTPDSQSTKKTFKRRNLAMYTPESDESVSTSSSYVDSSPITSKICRDS